MIPNLLRYICPGCNKPVKAYWAWLFRASGQVICLDCSEKYQELGAPWRDPKKEYKR